jgi:hypothetical protein
VTAPTGCDDHRMSVAVVNHLTLAVPAADLRAVIEREFPPAFDACPGFERFCVVQTGETDVVVLIFWDSAEHAAAGAARIGPTVFNTVVGPHLVEQDRRVGPVVVDHVAT